jgi:hypothetical protein
MASPARIPNLAGSIMLALLALLPGQRAAAQSREIIGTWRGTASCANRAKDLTCRNESVIYQIDTVGATRGNVMLRAHRIVNHDEQFMYALQFNRRPGSHTWQSDFTQSSFHGRWEYTINGSVMTGTLVEMPSKRLVRRVSVKLSAPVKRGV